MNKDSYYYYYYYIIYFVICVAAVHKVAYVGTSNKEEIEFYITIVNVL